MKTRVALCVNKNIGLKITKFLKSHEGTEICLLYLVGENKSHDYKIIKASGVKNKNIFRGNEIYKKEKHINFFKKKKIDFLILIVQLQRKKKLQIYLLKDLDHLLTITIL